MASEASPKSPAVIDNWSLTIIASTLDSSGYEYFPLSPPERRDRALLFAQLLDVLVLHETILCDENKRLFWSRSPSLASIDAITVSWKIAASPGSSEEIIFKSPRSIVAERATEYLRCARALGAPYWPAPERAKFLGDTTFALDGRFVALLKQRSHEHLDGLATEVYNAIGLAKPSLSFPGFGSAVASACQSPAEALSAAIELRQTKPAAAFRDWIAAVEHAMSDGDLPRLKRAAQDINDIFDELSRHIGVKPHARIEAKLTLGISPNVSLPLELPSHWAWLLRKNTPHLTFLRSYLANAAASAHALAHVEDLLYQRL